MSPMMAAGCKERKKNMALLAFADVLEIRNGKNQKSVENPDGKYPIYGSGGIMGYADKYICGEGTVIIGRKGSINNPIYVETPLWNVDTAFGLIADRTTLMPKYLYYFCVFYNFEALNTTVTIPSLTKANLMKIKMPIPSLEKQGNIVARLERIDAIIYNLQKIQGKFSELVQSRFVEMFGDPITNSLHLPTETIGDVCYLKAGNVTAADEIHEQSEEYSIPCYGGNGIRGYVKKATQEGMYPIIGRQGALCGNLQISSEQFHATEHAVIVTPLKGQNVVWLYCLLKYMKLYRFHTGAAQPGLSVKTLNTVSVIKVERAQQDKFATFFVQVDKSEFCQYYNAA